MKYSLPLAALAALVSNVAAKDGRTFAVLHFTSNYIVKSRMDPIVSPGVPSSHVHNVMGGSNFGLSSTGEDLVKSNCSNALIKGDNSNYWFPQLYFHDTTNNTFESVDVFYVNAYYFFEATNDDIKAFPTGLSMVTGNAMTRDPPAFGAANNLDPSKGPIQPIQFTCPRSSYNPPSYPANSDGTKAGMQDPNNLGAGAGFPDQNCDGYASPLRADMHFPSCYNPAAGLTDFKTNTVFPTDAGDGKADCPKGWIHTPHLFIEVYWNTPLFASRWTPGQEKQPFVLAEGDVTGYSSHADFMAGWDEPLLQSIIDNCDAGDSGMDKCPGITELNSGDCFAENAVPEQVTGYMDKLPGNNPLSGWSYGAAPAPPGAPASSAPAAPPKTSAAPPKSSAAPPKSTAAPPPPAKTTKAASKPTTTHTSHAAASTVASGSSSGSSISGWKHAGCYSDDNARVLTGVEFAGVGAVSNKDCVAFCSSKGFSLSGTEYGGQCFCGNDLVGSKKISDSACSMACEGDASDKCGGSWALTVYSKTGSVALKASKKRSHDHMRRHRSRANF